MAVSVLRLFKYLTLRERVEKIQWRYQNFNSNHENRFVFLLLQVQCKISQNLQQIYKYTVGYKKTSKFFIITSTILD